MPTTLRDKFRWHRNNARGRGIPFLLTFEEWRQLWEDSGHLAQRGPGKGQYCMARFGDTGPYAVGNVRIVSNRENVAELWGRLEHRLLMCQTHVGNTARSGKAHSEETRAVMRKKKLGKKPGSETRRKLSLSGIGNQNSKGCVRSRETLERMSKAQVARWARARTKQEIGRYVPIEE